MGSTAGAAWPLRPLGLGEILDRAITLTVRNFPLFALIAILYALPQAVFAYYGSENQAQLFGGFADAIRDAAAGKTVDFNAIIKAQNQSNVFNGFTVLLYLWLFTGLPLYTMALICAAALRYRGEAASVGIAYRSAFKRTLSLIAITLAYAAVALIAMTVLFVVVFSVLLGIGVIYRLSGGGSNAALSTILLTFFTVASLAAGAAMVALVVMGYMAVHIAWMSNVLEGAPVVRAVALGFSRVFSRPLLRRSLLVAAAYSVLSGGYTILVLVCVGLIGPWLAAMSLRSLSLR